MKFLIIIGLVFFIGSIVLIFANYDEVSVWRNGKIVQMKIEKLPSSCLGARVRYYVTYSYDGELYEKATRGDFCERHHEGELIEMKFLDGSKTILRPDESAIINLMSFVAMGVVGLGIAVYQWSKLRSN